MIAGKLTRAFLALEVPAAVKTQLAVAYAYDSRAEVYKDGIFWLNAAEPIVPQMAGAMTPCRTPKARQECMPRSFA